VIAGDFNRHNPLWGGDSISSTARQEKSEPIVEFMAELSLESLLPVGVTTFVSDRGRMSTIDLMLATPRLASELARCSIWEHEYRSDHRAICTKFWMEVEVKMLFKNADQERSGAAEGDRIPQRRR
jgi:hypothetical protein